MLTAVKLAISGVRSSGGSRATGSRSRSGSAPSSRASSRRPRGCWPRWVSAVPGRSSCSCATSRRQCRAGSGTAALLPARRASRLVPLRQAGRRSTKPRPAGSGGVARRRGSSRRRGTRRSQPSRPTGAISSVGSSSTRAPCSPGRPFSARPSILRGTGPDRLHVPLRTAGGLRRLPRDGAALLRASRRRRHPGPGHDLRLLSDAHHVATQGVVWSVGGRFSDPGRGASPRPSAAHAGDAGRAHVPGSLSDDRTVARIVLLCGSHWKASVPFRSITARSSSREADAGRLRGACALEMCVVHG